MIDRIAANELPIALGEIQHSTKRSGRLVDAIFRRHHEREASGRIFCFNILPEIRTLSTERDVVIAAWRFGLLNV